MKKIIILLLALVMLSACTAQPNRSASVESSASSSTKSSTSSMMLSTNSSSVVCNSPVNGKYSFSEVDVIYGPGPFSVNDLARIFGEPTFIGGYRWGGGAFAITVQFNDIQFDLVANNGEKLKFTVIDDSIAPSGFGRYAVTESDKAVRMKPLDVMISDGKWSLPRNMKIGDSRDKLTKAYHGDKGHEYSAEGWNVAYKYGQSGDITYTFSTYKSDASLSLDRVMITWYDSTILDPTPTFTSIPSGASFPPPPPT